MAKKKSSTTTPSVENRKARHNYFILDTLEVGIVLRGTEVKSVRDGRISIAEGYVRVEPTPPALYLHGVDIGEYAPAGPLTHSAKRTRKLLAHKREILKLARAVDQKGVTVIPLKLYFKDGYAKLLIGLGKGKAAHDKRESIKDRDAKRDISRAMSRRM